MFWCLFCFHVVCCFKLSIFLAMGESPCATSVELLSGGQGLPWKAQTRIVWLWHAMACYGYIIWLKKMMVPKILTFEINQPTIGVTLGWQFWSIPRLAMWSNVSLTLWFNLLQVHPGVERIYDKVPSWFVCDFAGKVPCIDDYTERLQQVQSPDPALDDSADWLICIWQRPKSSRCDH